MIEVNIGACTCPGTPHPDGDLVYLREKMGLAGGSILTSIVSDYLTMPSEERPPTSSLTAALRVSYVEQGVTGWNLTGEGEFDLPFSAENLRAQILDDYARGTVVADKADELYYEAVLAPLLARVAQLSQPTPTKPRTSRTRSSRAKGSRLRSIPGSGEPPITSKPSSTSTSLTDYTERTSIGRVSASSS